MGEFQSYVTTVITECDERAEQFIFKTMGEYIEYAVETVIPKDILLDALFEYKKKHPEKFKRIKKEFTSVDEKVNEIVEEYHCGSAVDCTSYNCDECKENLKKDLMELVTLVQKNRKN